MFERKFREKTHVIIVKLEVEMAKAVILTKKS